jgi:2-polyprenyl-3-methyl-5-hydroxy-6-metoxy-1,4-benzoquinol methylase
MRTEDPEYAARLVRHQGTWWKRLLDVQAPYRSHLRRLNLGRTLDVGCGIGRNLAALPPGSVGVDHNAAAVEVARARGLVALGPQAFAASSEFAPGCFDSMLISHVLEHLSRPDAVALMRAYLPFVRTGGRIVLIVPQAAGFRSDPTHVDFVDSAAIASIATATGLALARSYTFPLPSTFGAIFKYNELVGILVKRS